MMRKFGAKEGEGSRGGYVMGHTKSGHPIYARMTGGDPAYKHLSSQDHIEAAAIHKEYAKKVSTHYGETDEFWHNKRAEEHEHMSKMNNIQKAEGRGKMVRSLIQQYYDEGKIDTVEFLKANIQLSHLLDVQEGAYELEKGGPRAAIGEVRPYGGRDYIKTINGWVLHKKHIKAQAATVTEKPKAEAKIEAPKKKGGFQREKFISTPVKVGDIFYVENPKPGYYNQRRIESIDNGLAKISVVEETYGGRVNNHGDAGHMRLSEVQRVVDKTASGKHDKVQNHKEAVHEFNKKIGLEKLKGGSLLDPKARKEFKTALEKLKSEAEIYTKPDSSVGAAGGWSGTMRSSQSGTPINLSFNDVHRAGYYGFNRMYTVQVQVGGGLESEHRKVLLASAKDLLSKYSFKTSLGDSRIEETDGTNWSSVMMVAPTMGDQYSRIEL